MGRNIYEFHESELLSKIELEENLSNKLIGESLSGLPLRTRSKVLKVLVCRALNYDVPTSFLKTKPKFPCQQFDVYVQKSNNLQIWNDEISPERRYVLIKLNDEDIITKIKVIDGEDLKKLDTTGKLTTKYQARVPSDYSGSHTTADSDELKCFLNEQSNISGSPMALPNKNTLLSIKSLYNRIKTLIGYEIKTTNLVQERTTADDAHQLVCKVLGYKLFEDDGQFPDIPNQLLEVKLQMSPTIDLGLHKPDSDESTTFTLCGKKITISMCRYLILTAHRVDEHTVKIDDLFIVAGDKFFSIFTLFGGKVQNAKLQIPLPGNFWN